MRSNAHFLGPSPNVLMKSNMLVSLISFLYSPKKCSLCGREEPGAFGIVSEAADNRLRHAHVSAFSPFLPSRQVGHNGHSSVEDAQATMELYKVIEAEWEMHLAVSPAQE